MNLRVWVHRRIVLDYETYIMHKAYISKRCKSHIENFSTSHFDNTFANLRQMLYIRRVVQWKRRCLNIQCI